MCVSLVALYYTGGYGVSCGKLDMQPESQFCLNSTAANMQFSAIVATTLEVSLYKTLTLIRYVCNKITGFVLCCSHSLIKIRAAECCGLKTIQRVACLPGTKKIIRIAARTALS